MSSSTHEGEPPSVGHVVSYYPPDRIGGVGEHVRVLHEGYLGSGGDSLVVTSGESRGDPTVIRVGNSTTGFMLASWRGASALGRRDVVQVHHGEGLLLLLALRLRKRRPKIVTMFHVDVRAREKASGPHWFDGRRFGPRGLSRMRQLVVSWPKVFIDRIVWLLADAAVVETNAVRDDIADLRPARPVTVIQHGLGVSPGSEISHDPVELLYVGTPGIRKRTHLLPNILYRVQQRVPDARLRIVGFSPADDPELRAEAIRLGVLDSIEFVGAVRSEEVVPHYRSAQVLVLPSAYEGLPMVLLEAMREGLVPVATNVSGHPDAITDGLNGYLVPVDRVEEMSCRCGDVLTDKRKAAEMSRRCQGIVRDEFGLNRELKAYEALYRTLIEHASVSTSERRSQPEEV